MVVLKLAVLALFVGVGLFYVDPRNWTPFAPNGWTRHPPGRGDRVLRLHRLRRGLAPRPRRRRTRRRNMPRRHPGLARHLHRHLRDRRAWWPPGSCPTSSSRAPIPWRGPSRWPGIGWGQAIISFGAVVSMTAVLLVFQLGQPRIFFSMSRDGLLPPVVPRGPPELPHAPRHHDRHRDRGGAGLVDPRRRRDLRPHEHRHAVRLPRGLPGRARAADQGARPAAAVPRALRVAGGPARGGAVRVCT